MKTIAKFILTISVLSLVACGSVGGARTPSKVLGSGDSEDVLKHAFWSKNATMYEVNVRQHTQEGTLLAFAKDLPRLKELGIDILWFMPLYPVGEINRKGGDYNNSYIAEKGSSSLGSPYCVKDYMAVSPEYGTLDELKSVVFQAHELGMRVILDWVANYSAFDCEWTQSQRGYYLLDSAANLQPPSGSDHWDVTQFDWENGVQNGLYEAMVSAMEFWVEECDVDGFRCDVAEKVPVAFWEMARRRLEIAKPDVFMLADADQPIYHNRAFDMSCALRFHHVIGEIAQGHQGISVISEYVQEEYERFPSDAYRMGFATNHDENSQNGAMSEMYGEAADAMVILSATLFDMPLMYSGQESDLEKRLRFFEKDTIEWGGYSKSEFYRSINTLHHEEEALWNGPFGGFPVLLECESPDRFFAFTKLKANSQIVVILNLSSEPSFLSVNMPEGDFEPAISKGIGEDGVVAPWGFIVLRKING